MTRDLYNLQPKTQIHLRLFLHFRRRKDGLVQKEIFSILLSFLLSLEVNNPIVRKEIKVQKLTKNVRRQIYHFCLVHLSKTGHQRTRSLVLSQLLQLILMIQIIRRFSTYELEYKILKFKSLNAPYHFIQIHFITISVDG